MSHNIIGWPRWPVTGADVGMFMREGEPGVTDTGVAPTGPADGIVSAGEQARIAAADARAANTRRTYAGQWARFGAWCRALGAQALPAAPVLVAAYLTERVETARISTVRVAAAAIGAAHRARGADDPTATASVRALVAGIARQHAARADAAPSRAALVRECRHAPGARAATPADRPRRRIRARGGGARH